MVSIDNLTDFFIFTNSEIYRFDYVRRADRKIVMLLIVMRFRSFINNIVLNDMDSHSAFKYLDAELQRIFEHANKEEN